MKSEEVDGGKHANEPREVRVFAPPSYTKDPSFPGHAPGKDTLRAANAATKEGSTGRKRVKRKRLPVVFPSFPERGSTGENARANAVSGRALSPVLICLFVQIRDPSFPGHAPGKDTLRAANAATKTRFTGRKQNKRKRILLSSRRSPKEGANGGENTRTSHAK